MEILALCLSTSIPKCLKSWKFRHDCSGNSAVKLKYSFKERAKTLQLFTKYVQHRKSTHNNLLVIDSLYYI